MKEISLKEALSRMIDGETCYHGIDTRFVKYFGKTGTFEDKHGYIEDFSGKWFVKEPPKMRPMTRDEVLGFIANTQGIVVRTIGGDGFWRSSNSYSYIDPITKYEWTTITPDGVYGEPQKFEKEVSDES